MRRSLLQQMGMLAISLERCSDFRGRDTLLSQKLPGIPSQDDSGVGEATERVCISEGSSHLREEDKLDVRRVIKHGMASVHLAGRQNGLSRAWIPCTSTSRQEDRAWGHGSRARKDHKLRNRAEKSCRCPGRRTFRGLERVF